MNKQKRFVFGNKVFLVQQQWLGFWTTKAYIVNGDTKMIGKSFIGKCDIRTAFFRYLGAA